MGEFDGGLSPPASKKQQLLSAAMKRTSEWLSRPLLSSIIANMFFSSFLFLRSRIFSQEIPSDVTVYAGGASFSLHKYPLVSKCGLIRRMVLEANDADLSLLDLPDVPGGAEAFELVAKFCYGINFEITTETIAMIHCAAEYLEMTEDYAAGNLVNRAEDYLNEAALTTLPTAIAVLHEAQTLLPASEKTNLISRCVEAVAVLACEVEDWLDEELTDLEVDIFKRLVKAILRRSSDDFVVGPLLMLYAQKSLRDLDVFGRTKKKIDQKIEHEKRIILETIVSLLPKEKNAISVSFLATLLRSAIFLETTMACRLDLEKRISSQLDQAVLDDLLIPSYSSTSSAFDVDTVQRIFLNYLETEDNCNSETGTLMQNYLAEISSDPNFTIRSFVNFADTIPESARISEDAMYRAVDIFLKAHPSITDTDRKKVCGVMDCQKLSREACAHAAKNSRLPAQIIVQVLYYEQQRLRDNGGSSPASSLRSAAEEELNRLRRENEGLKLEVVKLKRQIREAENPPNPVAVVPFSSEKPPLPKKSLVKKLGKLVRPDWTKSEKKTKPPKDRRHSVS